MLRRDFEIFFLGTAMTISRTGAPLPCAKRGGPQKSYGRALAARRADFSSQNVTAPQQFSGRGGVCPSGSPNRQKDAGAAHFGPAGRPAGAWAAHLPASPPAGGDRGR